GLPGGGVTRMCWSPPHEEARAWLLGEMRAAGLETWVDPAGNIFGATGIRALRPETPVVLTGSHIDTAPEGGILDGALGVLAVAAYVELHIEQGPRLEEAGIPIGVVEAIVGVRRSRVIFLGQADHAGTTPMERRRDAFLAAADYALRVREHVVTRGSKASVTNFGVVHVHPGASNIVPGRAELVHEMRDPDVSVLERLA